MSGVCGTYGEKKNVSGLMVGTPEGKPISRWRYSIETDPARIRWDDVECVNLAQDRDRWRAVVSTMMNLQIP
jgi:hypothetical protein